MLPAYLGKALWRAVTGEVLVRDRFGLKLCGLAAAAIVTVGSSLTQAAVHIGGQNPLTERWRVVSGDTGVSGTGVFDSEYAWQINSNASGRLRYETDGPLRSDSWVYDVRLRVVTAGDAVDAGVLLEVANGVQRFMIEFGSDADGATLINLLDDGHPDPVDVIIPPAHSGVTDYVHVVLAYDAALGVAEFFYNGQQREGVLTGLSSSLRRVNFGDGAAADVGQARYSRVEFRRAAPQCADGIDNDNDGLVDFAGADGDCLSSVDPVEGVYCPLGADVDADGICEQIVVSHSGSADPNTQGWQAPAAAAGQSWQAGDQDIGAGNCADPCPFWRMVDAGQASGNLGTYVMNSFTTDAPGGWEYRSTVRVHPLNMGVAESPSYAKSFYLRFPDGGDTHEFGARFGVDAEGDLQLQPSGSSEIFNIGATSLYHDIRIVFDPVSATADFIVDGVLLVEDSTGRVLVSGNERSVRFGSGDSSGTGRTHWHAVALELNPDTDNDGLPNAQELSAGTNPYATDTDEDGLTDDAELVSGSNALEPDTDGDGLIDGYEVRSGLDPMVADPDLDPDDDGLSNSEEQELGTLALTADSDGDGLEDGWEIALETDPLTADSDGDGLNDGEEEAIHRTDPARADTDADAVNDGDELMAGTNPLDSDSDADGLEDGLEAAAGTQPLVSDTDGDGLLDGFEVRNGLNPLVAGDEAGDEDGDGLENLAEQTFSSDVNNPDTDGDGLTDAEEALTYGSDPTKPDTDSDGLLDAFEIAYGFSPLSWGDGRRDADNDGLTNAEEQHLGLDPLLADSDEDGLLDGEETYIFGTQPAIPEPVSMPLAHSMRLEFEATGQPLFDDLPEPTFVDLAPVIADQTGGTIRRGNVVDIERVPSTLTAQDVWDAGVAQCDAENHNIPVSNSVPACADLNVSPTRNECINGGNVSYASRSVSCCASSITGVVDLLDHISNGCYFGNSAQSFTINDLNGLPGGPYVSPTSINVGSGFGPRPETGVPLPPRSYRVGAEIAQSTQVTGGITITPGLSTADPGEVDVYYDTDARVRVDRSVAAPGEVVTLTFDHIPLPFSGPPFTGTGSSCSAEQSHSSGSCLSSRWPDFQTGLDLDVNIDLSVEAEIWSIDPESGDQLHITQSLFDQNLGRSYELAAFDWRIGDSLDMRLLNEVPAVPSFIQQDISISNEDTLFNLWDPGTALPLPVDIPFGCFLKKISERLCITFGMPESALKTNLMTFQLQIPELNTPVTQAVPGDISSRGFNGGAPTAFSAEVVEPLRHHLNAQGQLVNTVPNRYRPALNLTQLDGSAESLIDTFIFSHSDLSSDVFRYELDLDGMVCINSAGSACLGASASIPFVASLSVDAIDQDLVLWTGWDSTMTFEPNLVVTLTFSRAVQARLGFNGPFEPVAAGQSYPIDVPAGSAGLQHLQIIQPAGGVDVDVSYDFSGNTFTSEAHYAVKLAVETAYLQAEIGGALGAIYEDAVGVPWRLGLINSISEAPPVPAETLTSAFNLTGPQMTFQGPGFRLVDAGSDQDGDGIEDAVEHQACTLIDDADSDDDGLPDGIEDSNRNGQVDPGESDPCLADTDGDGLLDGAERGLVTPHPDTHPAVFEPTTAPLLRTDPNDPDTDGDGFSDGDEMLEGANPLDAGDCPPSACGGSGILRLLPIILQEQQQENP